MRVLEALRPVRKLLVAADDQPAALPQRRPQPVETGALAGIVKIGERDVAAQDQIERARRKPDRQVAAGKMHGPAYFLSEAGEPVAAREGG
jgi:hypothetical protein